TGTPARRRSSARIPRASKQATHGSNRWRSSHLATSGSCRSDPPRSSVRAIRTTGVGATAPEVETSRCDGARVDMLSMPQLEDQQLPQIPGSIPLAREVFLEHAVHDALVEVPALSRQPRTQHIAERFAQRSPEPVA